MIASRPAARYLDHVDAAIPLPERLEERVRRAWRVLEPDVLLCTPTQYDPANAGRYFDATAIEWEFNKIRVDVDDLPADSWRETAFLRAYAVAVRALRAALLADPGRPFRAIMTVNDDQLSAATVWLFTEREGQWPADGWADSTGTPVVILSGGDVGV
ncbi:hypothetical protein EV193_10423 [Herbihabitans rhizosphaerae]|uniref:Uncharacterized protein n=1 Tax=Herbihabitans rhizosphaerae TaxID=1872711 RepID=A0A4Q7KQS3_9PSEU|nr:hypothetical protein [Herbihabitans rhizosphaerae]RZS38814.1 hypothetical protein EV193_10423 [Herbihabitans rhizosphaerae]